VEREGAGEEDARGKRMWKEKAQGRKGQGKKEKGKQEEGKKEGKDPPVMPILIQSILRRMIFLPSTPIEQTWR
jgi:hypothetical protein